MGGVFLVLRWDDEDGLFELIVAEFLKGDGRRDGGEDGDVWREKGKTRFLNSFSDQLFNLSLNVVFQL